MRYEEFDFFLKKNGFVCPKLHSGNLGVKKGAVYCDRSLITPPKSTICDVFIINMPFTEIEAPSPSREQDKAVSEHGIPLGRHKFYNSSDLNLNV